MGHPIGCRREKPVGCSGAELGRTGMFPPRSGQAVDWPAIRARISKAAAEEALNPSSARAKQILDARAHALARTPTEEQPAGESIAEITFALAYESYAVETHSYR